MMGYCTLFYTKGILLCVLSLVFFFKQKTAYEMRISDWSSDVCSSDLAKGLMKASIREDNPVLFLLPTRRGGEQGEVPDGDHVVPLGKGSVKREGRDVTVVAIGVMVRHAMRAAATLSEE